MDGTHGNPGGSGRGFGRPEASTSGGAPRFAGNMGDARKGRGRRGKRQPGGPGGPNPGGARAPVENQNSVVGLVDEEDDEEGELADLPEVLVPGSTTGSSGRHIIGTCTLMCPPAERELRSRKNDIELFERLDASDRNASDETLAVKKYTRIVDNVTPSMVRTREALAMTANHLYRLLDTRPEVHFMIKSKFLWDRLRSVRQDLSLQQITDTFAETLLEQMVRFAMLSEHELCEEAATVNNPDGHNSHLNVEQLAKTLTSLRHMYDDRAARGIGRTDRPQSEAEMFSFQLLLRIDSHGRYNVQRSEMLNDLRSARPAVLLSPAVQLALAANRAYHSNNIHEFFRIVKSASFLQACVLHKYFSKIRARALEMINATYGKQAMPIIEVARLLHCSCDEAEALAVHHGLTVQKKHGRGGGGRGRGDAASDGSKNKVLMIREAGFIEPADEFPILRSPIVDGKRASTYLHEIVPTPGPGTGTPRNFGNTLVRSPPRANLAVPKPRVVTPTKTPVTFEPPVGSSPRGDLPGASPSRVSPARDSKQGKQLIESVKARQTAAEVAAEKLRADIAAKELEMRRKKAQKQKQTAQAAGPSSAGPSVAFPPATTNAGTTSTPVASRTEKAQFTITKPDVSPAALNKNAVPFSPVVRETKPTAPSFPSFEPPSSGSSYTPHASTSPTEIPGGLAGGFIFEPAKIAVPPPLAAEPEKPPSPSPLVKEERARAEAFVKAEETKRALEREAKLREAEKAMEAQRAAEEAQRAADEAQKAALEAEKAAYAARAVQAARAREAERLAREEEAKRRAERAAAAALVAAKLARRAEKARVARYAFAVYKWRQHASAQIHQRREAKIAASRTAASPIPGIAPSALRAAVPKSQKSVFGFSNTGVSTALATLRVKLDASRNVPWGSPLDVPSILRKDETEAGHLSHWKLLTCSGFENSSDQKKSISHWLRAKLSRGRASDERSSGNQLSSDQGSDGNVLSLYASKPFVEDNELSELDDAKMLWVCARDVPGSSPIESSPRRYASAAVFVLDIGTQNKLYLSAPIPGFEEQRLRAFVASLQCNALLPLLVLCACPASCKNWRAIEANIEAIVSSEESKRRQRRESDSAITVRVTRLAAMRDLDTATAAEWQKWNDELSAGVRWLSSVAPPAPYFQAAYLRDEMANALTTLNVPDAHEATPGECVAVWNQAVEGVLSRLSSEVGTTEKRDEGLAVEFSSANTVGAFRKSNASNADEVFRQILDFAKLPEFPEPVRQTDSSTNTFTDRVTTYLTTLDPGGQLPPGAVDSFFKKTGVSEEAFLELSYSDKRHPIWPALFREIFARRLQDIETTQKMCGAGCVYVSPVDVGSPMPLPLSATPAPLSDCRAQIPVATRKITASPASAKKPSPEKQSQKRKRISFDTSVPVFLLNVPAAETFPQLARAREGAENLEAWLLDAASPALRGDGDDAAAKLRRLAGWELKMFF